MPSQNRISVDLQGGLGNQLFCYSAGYYVALRNNFDLECQMTTAYNSTKRDDSILSGLKLPGTFVSSKPKMLPKKTIIDKALTRLSRKFGKNFHFKLKKNYVSNVLGYDPILDSFHKPTKLNGYFQTWRYPLIAREVIAIALKNEVILNDYAKELIGQMKLERILVVHIRLGDYKNPENSFIGILSPEYYAAILKRLELCGYKVFVFSDDILEAKAEYGATFPPSTTWVDQGGVLNPLETLVVMSHGKAFAIANSTFSWWSAFLSHNPEMIIAPSKWFKNRNDPEELIPSDWHREASQWAN